MAPVVLAASLLQPCRIPAATLAVLVAFLLQPCRIWCPVGLLLRPPVIAAGFLLQPCWVPAAFPLSICFLVAALAAFDPLLRCPCSCMQTPAPDPPTKQCRLVAVPCCVRCPSAAASWQSTASMARASRQSSLDAATAHPAKHHDLWAPVNPIRAPVNPHASGHAMHVARTPCMHLIISTCFHIICYMCVPPHSHMARMSTSIS